MGEIRSNSSKHFYGVVFTKNITRIIIFYQKKKCEKNEIVKKII